MSFGQYSYNGVGRLTLPEILPYGTSDGRKAGHNRATYTRADGTRCFRLIGTDVVTLSPKGVWTFDDGGFATVTTRTAWAQGFKALRPPVLLGAAVNACGASKRRGKAKQLVYRHHLGIGTDWRERETGADPFPDRPSDLWWHDPSASNPWGVRFLSRFSARITPHGFDVVSIDEGVDAWRLD